MYHGLCHKKLLSDTYKKKFLKFETEMEVGLNEYNVNDERFLFDILNRFMKERNYDYIKPNELSIASMVRSSV
jgi:hypothetical protein